MSIKEDYIMETKELEQKQNEIFYNCTECSSAIEILSINENECSIEFQCINNNHKIKMLINEYINKIKKFNNNNIKNDICITHNLKYECFCLDCKIHLWKDCLKLRNHVNHLKNNIIEIQPDKKEIDIYEKIIKNYEDRIEKLEIEKINKTRKLNNKFTEHKNKLKIIRESKLNENKNKKEKELKQSKMNI